jgi:hypothetical protein
MADKKIKINQNPVKAFYQGKQFGREEAMAEMENLGHAEDIYRGIILAYAYMLHAMAYTNEKDDGSVYLSKPKFKEFYTNFAKTLQNFVNESIEGEQGIDTYDIADLYVGHDTKIRERYGLPLKKYDGKDDVI